MATVDETIAQQQEYASNAVSQADNFLSALSDLATSSYFVQSNAQPIPNPGFGFDISTTQKLLLDFFPLAISVSDINTGTRPDTFVSASISAPDNVVIPEFTETAPTLAIPEAPSTALPSAPVAPSIATPTLPTAPTFSLPTAPTLGSITFPDVPTINIPDLTATLPTDDVVAPTNNFEFFEVAYASALLDALKAKLLDAMENGSYGLEASDEAALFDRARSREVEGAQAQADVLITEAAGRGFPFPPGDLTVLRQRAEQDLQNKVSTLSRDIMLKRADLFHDTWKFTITEARALEDLLIGFHNNVMERSLNAAKATLDAGIRIFEAQVARFNVRLERYKADAIVFEAKVRASVAQMEIFRTEMEGVRIQSDVQRTQVEVYKAQLDGVNALVNIYKTQNEVVQIQAGIERLRIESFRALVDAYGAQVQAKTAEFGMYEARIRGEVAKMNAFEAQVRAFVAQVEAKKTQADILIAQYKGRLEGESQRIEVYKTALSTYQSDISAQAEVVRARTSVYSATVAGASAKAGALAEAHRLEITDHELQFRRNVENANIAIKDATLFLQAALGSAEARTRAGGYASDYYKTLAGSALSSIGTLAAHQLVE